MNHFFAIELADNVRQDIWRIAQGWRRRLGPSYRASWYAPEDYHVTLKFLGDVEEARQPDLLTAAAPVASATALFPVGLTAPGAFPSLRRPNVLWIGVWDDLVLADLAARLNQALVPFGFLPEKRRYRPHVTVARCRPSRGEGVEEWPKPTEQAFAGWQASRLVLMQTLPPEQRANGAKGRYNVVHTFPFGEATP